MDISFFYNLLKLTSLSDEQVDDFVKEYSDTVNIAIFNVFFEEFGKLGRNDLVEKLRALIVDKAELLKSLDIVNEDKKNELDQRFEQILLEIKNPLVQNSISESISKKIEELDDGMIDKVVSVLTPEDKNKLFNNLNKILSK